VTPNERRALANAMTHQLRRGWLRHKASRTYSSNPRGWSYSSARGFPTSEHNRSTEQIEKLQYVRAFVEADTQLATRDMSFELIRTDYDAALSSLAAEYQAVWVEFLDESLALPFHRSGVRLRWQAERCPAGAQRVALRLTLACSIEFPDARDVADEYAAEEQVPDLAQIVEAVERGAL
jgi:hypothetical protein